MPTREVRHKSEELRDKAEARARKGEDDMHEAMQSRLSPGVSRLIHELRVHQIELELQNEELRETQEKLETSRSRYFDLYDLAPVGYFTISEEGVILEANLTAAALLGITRDSLVQKPFSKVILPDDQDIYYRHRLKCNAARSGIPDPPDHPQSCELRIHTPEGRTFWAELETTSSTDGRGQHIVRMTMNDITTRKHAEERIATSLHEKEVLLKEIHHRVKNNLQIVCSLLSIQSNYATDPESRRAFITSQDRVRSMALAHENMYRSGDLAAVDFAEHLRTLTDALLRTYAKPGIRCTVEAEGVKFGIDVAIPCGLLITELVSNALKHAFPQRDSGTIVVSVQRTTPGYARLTVQDDGVGFPADQDWHTSPSMGTTLIQLLGDQLGGVVAMTRNHGTSFTVEFPTRLDH